MMWIEKRMRIMGRTATFYPNATVYLLGSGVIIAATAGWLEAGQALTTLTVGFVIILTLALRREAVITKREIENVHVLVNSQHDELLNLLVVSDRRILQLTQALEEAHIVVPKKPEGNPP